MRRLILETRSAAAAARSVPRSAVAARMRKVQAEHHQVGRAMWARVQRRVLAPVLIRMRWHDTIAAAVTGDVLLLRQWVDWHPKREPQQPPSHPPALSVDELMKELGLQPARPQTSEAKRKYVMPLSARPPWQHHCARPPRAP